MERSEDAVAWKHLNLFDLTFPYLITGPCFENITHDYPSALTFYKINFVKLCNSEGSWYRVL
jgi:hypothetical protein